MARIKNWKKIGDKEWKNTVSGMVVGIEEFPIKGSGYNVYGKIPGMKNSFELYEVTQGDSFARLEGAEKELKKYMRSHPIGKL